MPRREIALPAQAPLDDEPPRDDDEDGDEPEAPRAVTNGELARVFHEIGDILEVKGELVFKTVAYHRAADAIARAPFDVGATYAAGERRPIPGVGAAIADKIVELATTGHMAYYEQAAGRDPAHPRRPAAHPGRRAEDRAASSGRGSGSRTSPGLKAGGAGTGACGRSRASRRAPRSAILEGIEKLETAPAPAAASTGPRPRATTSPSSCAACPA